MRFWFSAASKFRWKLLIDNLFSSLLCDDWTGLTGYLMSFAILVVDCFFNKQRLPGLVELFPIHSQSAPVYKSGNAENSQYHFTHLINSNHPNFSKLESTPFKEVLCLPYFSMRNSHQFNPNNKNFTVFTPWPFQFRLKIDEKINNTQVMCQNRLRISHFTLWRWQRLTPLLAKAI
jgi:hypothetical protein